MMQSILVLLYVCGHFVYDFGGTFRAITLLALFTSIEAFLFRVRPALLLHESRRATPK